MDVIITGASRGIGFETALAIASQAGTRVLALSRDLGKLRQLGHAIANLQNGSSCIPLSLDLENNKFPVKLLDVIHLHEIRPSLLINNAGLLIKGKVTVLDSVAFDRMFTVNVKSAFILVQTLLPYFEKESHILNISSMGGVQGSTKFPGLSLYSASKGALAILTESLAEELKGDKISVNCVAIGAVQTEMLSEAFPEYKATVSPQQMGQWIADFALNGHKIFNGKIIPAALSTP